jgi:hypothetical protein
MKLSKSIHMGAWLIIALNLLMAVGSIGVFNRMTPSIEEIISKNGRSLQACESMLSALAQRSDGINSMQSLRDDFEKALANAEENITETGEAETLEIIRKNFTSAFSDGSDSLNVTVRAINRLRELNWNATYRADQRAKQIGYAGAWGVSFMGIFVFIAGMIFKQRVVRYLIEPLQEIIAVLSAQNRGDTARRCSGLSPSADIRKAYGIINDLIDRSSHK